LHSLRHPNRHPFGLFTLFLSRRPSNLRNNSSNTSRKPGEAEEGEAIGVGVDVEGSVVIKEFVF